MKWLLNRIHRWGRAQNEQVVIEAPVSSEPPEAEGPPLLLLVQDASAPSSYRLHTFPNGRFAEEFVQLWFGSSTSHGILAFWALHTEPEQQKDHRPAEVAVMIRDEGRPDIVYPFSLPDMELARSWLAKERTRGLNFDDVLLYWAAPVSFEQDRWGRLCAMPSEPPPLRCTSLSRPMIVVRRDEGAGNHVAGDEGASDENASDESASGGRAGNGRVGKRSASNGHSAGGAAGNARSGSKRKKTRKGKRNKKARPLTLPVDIDSALTKPESVEEIVAPEAGPAEEPATPKAEAAEKAAAPEPESVEEAATPQAEVAEEPAPEAEPVEEVAASEPEPEPVAEADKPDVKEAEEAAIAQASAGDGRQDVELDIADRLIRDALGGNWRAGSSRFEQHEGPFRGFGSPPGKF